MTEPEHYYGEAPVALRKFELPDWQEFMHYQYLPVHLARSDEFWRYKKHDYFTLPPRLEFLNTELLWWVLGDATETLDRCEDDLYVYVTAKRRHAGPGNALNRPGWHCDDFGGTDLNYIWMDAFPTRVLRSDKPLAIPDDDAESMQHMEWIAAQVRFPETYRSDSFQRQIENGNVRIEEVETNTLLRLSPYVIHATPDIVESGMRSFLKISISTHRYDLVGNSHNYDLDYDWPMYDRQELRNQPGAFQNKDYSH